MSSITAPTSLASYMPLYSFEVTMDDGSRLNTDVQVGIALSPNLKVQPYIRFQDPTAYPEAYALLSATSQIAKVVTVLPNDSVAFDTTNFPDWITSQSQPAAQIAGHLREEFAKFAAEGLCCGDDYLDKLGAMSEPHQDLVNQIRMSVARSFLPAIESLIVSVMATQGVANSTIHELMRTTSVINLKNFTAAFKTAVNSYHEAEIASAVEKGVWLDEDGGSEEQAEAAALAEKTSLKSAKAARKALFDSFNQSWPRGSGVSMPTTLEGIERFVADHLS